MEKENLFLNGSSNDLSCSSSSFFTNPNWDNSSLDQTTDPFESALSSMVSSPTANHNPNAAENGSVLRELIGRLGSICNSAEISPPPPPFPAASCYSTPLSSPPKLNLSIMENQHQIRGNSNSSQLTINPGSHLIPNSLPFSADPGFAERAARFSCFANTAGLGLDSGGISGAVSGRISGSNNHNNQAMAVQESRGVDGAGVSPSDKKKFRSSSTPENVEFGDSRENSSLSEQIPPPNDAISRKRKSAIPKGQGQQGKPKLQTTTTPPKDTPHVASENSESGAKRSKSEDGNEKDQKTKASASSSSKDNDSKPPAEPPKDYIHVRARRGQATDAHSLAERVRREKISERMKVLQDLVPGCNKVTGKAVMLDEIINYVQSLQRQVEFLSMKLAAVNPRMELDMEAVASKDVLTTHGMYHSSWESYQHFHSQPNLHTNAVIPDAHHVNNGAGSGRSHSLQHLVHPAADNISEITASQVSTTFWEDDLHSFVQMGFGQNQRPTNAHGGIRMKVEL